VSWRARLLSCLNLLLVLVDKTAVLYDLGMLCTTAIFLNVIFIFKPQFSNMLRILIGLFKSNTTFLSNKYWTFH